MELSFFQLDDPLLAQIRDEILELDVNNLTPVEALNKLNDIKKLLKGKWFLMHNASFIMHHGELGLCIIVD